MTTTTKQILAVCAVLALFVLLAVFVPRFY